MKKFSSALNYLDMAWHCIVILSPLIGLSIFWNIPEEYIFHGPVLCLFKRFLHVECPGCGMVRAFYCVVHFNFTAAFYYNKLVVIVFPMLSLLILSWMVKKCKNASDTAIFDAIKKRQ